MSVKFYKYMGFSPEKRIFFVSLDDFFIFFDELKNIYSQLIFGNEK